MIDERNTLIYLVSHNHINFLESCVNSILEQIDNKTDLIIIDSGSTDGSNDFLKKIAFEKELDFFTKRSILTEIIDWVYENYANKYDYIMRVDGDDLIEKDAINRLRDQIKQDSNIGSVCGSWTEIDENSNVLNKMVLENGYANSAFHGACTLFRTRAIKDIKFKENKISSQDGLYTWLKIKDKWKCKTSSEFIFKYRRHESNLSNKEDKLFLGRCFAYKSLYEEKEFKSNACAVIGYNDDTSFPATTNNKNNSFKRILKQIKYIQDCSSIEKIYISSDSKIFNDIDLNVFTKVSILKRSKTEKTLIKSLQDCQILKGEIKNYSDVLLLNPLKNIWNSNLIDIAIYSKYVHSYRTIIACDLVKGTVFNEENGELNHVNFSNLNTVFTNDFLFVKLPGFLLVSSDDFYLIDDNYPKPIGHVSNNFLSLAINSF